MAHHRRFYDVVLPMSYSSYRVSGASPTYDYTMGNIAFLRATLGPQVSIHVIGGNAGALGRTETRAFVAACNQARVTGASLWHWTAYGTEDLDRCRPSTSRASCRRRPSSASLVTTFQLREVAVPPSFLFPTSRASRLRTRPSAARGRPRCRGPRPARARSGDVHVGEPSLRRRLVEEGHEVARRVGRGAGERVGRDDLRQLRRRTYDDVDVHAEVVTDGVLADGPDAAATGCRAEDRVAALQVGTNVVVPEILEQRAQVGHRDPALGPEVDAAQQRDVGGHDRSLRRRTRRRPDVLRRNASPLATAFSRSSPWKASISLLQPGSDAARMRTASRPALRAPPTDTVATGTPAGICTIESSESMPSRCSQRHRNADHRQRRDRGEHAGQVGRAAGAGDDHLEPAAGSRCAVLDHLARHPVRRHDVDLVRRRRTPRAPSAASSITGQSESLPMTIPTSGFGSTQLIDVSSQEAAA